MTEARLVTRCPYRAGWCEKDAGHDGDHYTTYRNDEIWSDPTLEAMGQSGEFAMAPNWGPENDDIHAAAPAEGLREALASLVASERHGRAAHPETCGWCGHAGSGHYKTCLWEQARAALDRHESTGCSVCGQTFAHYHRDTADGDEIVRQP